MYSIYIYGIVSIYLSISISISVYLYIYRIVLGSVVEK